MTQSNKTTNPMPLWITADQAQALFNLTPFIMRSMKVRTAKTAAGKPGRRLYETADITAKLNAGAERQTGGVA